MLKKNINYVKITYDNVTIYIDLRQSVTQSKKVNIRGSLERQRNQDQQPNIHPSNLLQTRTKTI